MSLHELVGSSIHLKLSIKEGHGFGFLKSPVVIVATINGILLETEVVSPSPDPQFQIDLVWETDKKNLRRFRASNTPIKVECFTVSPTNQRECIGCTLLNIKSAQVIASGSLKNVVEKWHRLIGVPAEAKALQPEILLSLTIQEPNFFSQPVFENTWESKKRDVDLIPQAKTSASVDSNIMHKTLPAFYPLFDFKQGYIQLGPEKSCSDMFLLHLIVKRALELDFLLGKIPSIDFIKKPFQISFSLMGQAIKTKEFGEENWEKECYVNEEVVLPIRSSLSTLNSYLQNNPCASVCFLHDGQEVAASELHIRSLVPTNDVQSFAREFGREFSITQNCLLVSSISGSIPSHGDLTPRIEVTARLQVTGFSTVPHNTISKPLLVTNEININSNNVPSQFTDEPFSRSESRESQDTFIVTSQSGPVWVPVAPGMAQSHPPCTKNAKGDCNRKTMTIRIVPNRIHLYQVPQAQVVRFLFESPNSLTIVSKCSDLFLPQHDETISIEGIHAKITCQSPFTIQMHIFLVGTDLNKSQLFATAKIGVDSLNLKTLEGLQVSCDLVSPSNDQKLGILDVSVMPEEELTNCQGTIATVETDSKIVKKLPPQASQSIADSCDDTACQLSPVSKTSDHLIVGSPLKNCGVNKLQNTSINKVQNFQELSSAIGLPCKSPASPCQKQSKTTSVVSLDPGAAYKIVEELEDWKEKQQDIFLAELKIKEKDHIARITEEWTAQTKAQTMELDKRMEECKLLTESLSNAKQDLRDRIKTCFAREQELKRAKTELELQYNLKFQELTLAARRLDEGVKLKVAEVESKCANLEERVKELQGENESLTGKFQQRASMKNHSGSNRMCGMSHDQVSQLLTQVDQLEGKLKASLQSKAYFKEQWGKAVREMNQAKLQFAHTSDNNKCLENLLGQEEKELQNDQKTLEKLRQEILCLNP